MNGTLALPLPPEPPPGGLRRRVSDLLYTRRGLLLLALLAPPLLWFGVIYLGSLLAHLPQGDRARFITPDEVAAAVWFLASPDVAPITGVAMPIEWGITAGY